MLIDVPSRAKTRRGYRRATYLKTAPLLRPIEIARRSTLAVPVPIPIAESAKAAPSMTIRRALREMLEAVTVVPT